MVIRQEKASSFPAILRTAHQTSQAAGVLGVGVNGPSFVPIVVALCLSVLGTHALIHVLWPAVVSVQSCVVVAASDGRIESVTVEQAMAAVDRSPLAHVHGGRSTSIINGN